MNKIIIAIAGYMGSGKTTCTKLLTTLGCREINADQEAKRLMSGSDAIKTSLTREFGPDVVVNDEIRYSLLGDIVFKSIDSVQVLNSIVHSPLVEHLRNRIDACSDNVILLDAALIPLWNIENWFNFRLWIHADFEVRLHRLNVLRSDGGFSMHQLAHRMSIQENLFNPPSAQFWKYITNEDTEHAFFEQIMNWISLVPEIAEHLPSE